MKLKLPKLKQRMAVNIERFYWEMVVKEKMRTGEQQQLIVEKAIKKMLGGKR